MKNNCIRLVDGKQLKYFLDGWPEKPIDVGDVADRSWINNSNAARYKEACQSALASAVNVAEECRGDVTSEITDFARDSELERVDRPGNYFKLKPDHSYFIGGTFEVRLKPQSDSDIWDVPGIVPNPVPPKQKNLAYWTEEERAVEMNNLLLGQPKGTRVIIINGEKWVKEITGESIEPKSEGRKKRDQQKKESWINNVIRVQGRTREDAEDIWNHIFSSPEGPESQEESLNDIIHLHKAGHSNKAILGNFTISRKS